ncbi:MAG: glycerophosphodiester phosphodiesterase family protein [Campylobacterota bacterium]|nr:glycerophosphodiester phosphodiesterase family protein [Campylobacterota bacterium]
MVFHHLFFKSTLLVLLTNTIFADESLLIKSLNSLKSEKIKTPLSYGVRPYYLRNQLEDSSLKEKLLACQNITPRRSDFSIAHRGAPLQFPEHTKESYMAAIHMGAGIHECDVTFTKDKKLVCRHSQCDLHQTTDILLTPLAEKCSEPFRPYDATANSPAHAKCCTSDITLEEFYTLQGTMDASNPKAANIQEFVNAPSDFRTDLYANDGGTLMSHQDSIVLFEHYALKMTPEIKSPSVRMPFNDFSQHDYIDAVVKEYDEAGVDMKDVFIQSFNLSDLLYLVKKYPLLAKNVIYLQEEFDKDYTKDIKRLSDIKNAGITTIAPPIWALVSLDKEGRLQSSLYAKALKEKDFKIITWSLERSKITPQTQGGWYYQSISKIISKNSDIYKVLFILDKEVGVSGVFSDWPATTTFYHNCMHP